MHRGQSSEDIPADLLLTDGLEILDTDILVRFEVHGLEDLAVFASANLLDDLITVRSSNGGIRLG